MNRNNSQGRFLCFARFRGAGAFAGRRAGDECGFALLIVLWSLVLLSFIFTQLLSAGRSEALLASNLRNAATAEAIANGGIHDALYHLTIGDVVGQQIGQKRLLQIGVGSTEVTVESLAGKINPNLASYHLLQMTFAGCGAPADTAVSLARAVMIWRGESDLDEKDTVAQYRKAGLAYSPPGRPMQSVEEVGLVIGMTPAMYACVLPHLSVAQDVPPTRTSSDPFVAHAVALAEEADGLVGEAGEAPATVLGFPDYLCRKRQRCRFRQARHRRDQTVGRQAFPGLGVGYRLLAARRLAVKFSDRRSSLNQTAAARLRRPDRYADWETTKPITGCRSWWSPSRRDHGNKGHSHGRRGLKANDRCRDGSRGHW